MRGPGRDHLVQPPADPPAGDDPRGPQHPQPGDQHEHPARAVGRPEHAPGLPGQVVICHREAAPTGEDRQDSLTQPYSVFQVLKTNTRFSATIRLLVGTKLNVHMSPPVSLVEISRNKLKILRKKQQI